MSILVYSALLNHPIYLLTNHFNRPPNPRAPFYNTGGQLSSRVYIPQRRLPIKKETRMKPPVYMYTNNNTKYNKTPPKCTKPVQFQTPEKKKRKQQANQYPRSLIVFYPNIRFIKPGITSSPHSPAQQPPHPNYLYTHPPSPKARYHRHHSSTPRRRDQHSHSPSQHHPSSASSPLLHQHS